MSEHRLSPSGSSSFLLSQRKYPNSVPQSSFRAVFQKRDMRTNIRELAIDRSKLARTSRDWLMELWWMLFLRLVSDLATSKFYGFAVADHILRKERERTFLDLKCRKKWWLLLVMISWRASNLTAGNSTSEQQTTSVRKPKSHTIRTSRFMQANTGLPRKVGIYLGDWSCFSNICHSWGPLKAYWIAETWSNTVRCWIKPLIAFCPSFPSFV